MKGDQGEDEMPERPMSMMMAMQPRGEAGPLVQRSEYFAEKQLRMFTLTHIASCV